MTEKIKTLKIIHLAICAGVVIAYFIIGEPTLEKLWIKHIDTTEIIYIAIPILAVILGNFLFKSQLRQISSKSEFESKFAIYQAASLIRWAVLEGAAFVLLFIKPNFMLFGILLIAYLVSLHPTEGRVKNDLQNNV